MTATKTNGTKQRNRKTRDRPQAENATADGGGASGVAAGILDAAPSAVAAGIAAAAPSMVAAGIADGVANVQGTWLGWLPPEERDLPDDQLITRDELLDRARELGIDLTVRTFRRWEAMGALPRPVRRWHNGAVRAVYPNWLTLMIPLAWEMRRDGIPYREVGERLRDRVPNAVALSSAPDVTNYERVPDDVVRPALAALADRHERMTGVRVTEAEIRLLDEHGRPVAKINRAIHCG